MVFKLKEAGQSLRGCNFFFSKLNFSPFNFVSKTLLSNFPFVFQNKYISEKYNTYTKEWQTDFDVILNDIGKDRVVESFSAKNNYLNIEHHCILGIDTVLSKLVDIIGDQALQESQCVRACKTYYGP